MKPQAGKCLVERRRGSAVLLVQRGVWRSCAGIDVLLTEKSSGEDGPLLEYFSLCSGMQYVGTHEPLKVVHRSCVDARRYKGFKADSVLKKHPY